MKVWITKYALTRGIIETEADICDTKVAGSMVRARVGLTPEGTYYHNDNWYASYEAASAKAESMRLAKIESLAKELGRLKRKSFWRMPRQPAQR